MEGVRGNIVHFDVLIESVVDKIRSREDVRRMIHDFADDQGSHFGIGVREAGPQPKIGHRRWIVMSESSAAHGGNVHAKTGQKTPKRKAVLGCSKINTFAKTGQSPRGIGREKINRIAVGGIERKIRVIAGATGIEPEMGEIRDISLLIEYAVGQGSQNGPRRNLELEGTVGTIA